MAVKTYSVARQGGTKLSTNFTVKEFRSKDGADQVLIDAALVILLQKIRDHFGAAITINSAYRTASHNKKVGGSPKSQHMYGTAADIAVKGITPLAVAQYAESLGAGGVGLYKNFTHVDVRAGKSRWDQRSGKQVVVSGFGGQPVIEKPKEAEEVAKVEQKKMTVNGRPVQLRAILEKGENYINLRDLVSAMGGYVGYNNATREITVDSGK